MCTYVCISLNVCVSLIMSVCVCVYVFLTVFVRMCARVSLSVCVCLCVCVYYRIKMKGLLERLQNHISILDTSVPTVLYVNEIKTFNIQQCFH